MTPREFGALLDRSMLLAFTREGLQYRAELPCGELTWNDHQGLYEWRREGSEASGFGTYLVRIDYSGGDRQHSSGGVMWQSGAPGGPFPPPALLGLHAAVSPERMN